MSGNKRGRIDNPKVTLPQIRQNEAPSLSADTGTSFTLLWQLSMVLKEIAKESKKRDVEVTSDKKQ